MSKWTRANPLAAVPGYSVPQGHFANGYTNGGDRVGFKKGGSVSEKSTHPSSRFKHTPKQPHGRHSPGNIKALYKAWGRTEKKKPHSTKEGRHATAVRKFGRVLREDAGMKKGGWIQKAVNPKHKGFCTPMTKKTCTPRRKALARTFKKMGKARKGK